nr:MAG TPA: hypothetical protein [Caudoviricetes sp.]
MRSAIICELYIKVSLSICAKLQFHLFRGLFILTFP